MARSKVEQANLALQKLGAKRISSFTQDHPNARSVSFAYDFIRQKELRAYEWNFATRRATIAADPAQTNWGQHNRFTLPNDYLYLILDDETAYPVDWTIEGDSDGRFIITDDAGPLYIKYVADIDDPNYYDSLFVEVFACSLADHCCEEITGSSTRKELLMKERQQIISRAYSQGALEKPSQSFAEDEWVTARY